VVRVHPETGERGPFIGGFAQRLVGLSNTGSRDILRLLQAYVTRPENTVRWHWAPGDLVIFDNRSTQHYTPDDYGDLPRTLHRVTVAGDIPVGVDGKRSYQISGDNAAHYTPVAVEGRRWLPDRVALCRKWIASEIRDRRCVDDAGARRQEFRPRCASVRPVGDPPDCRMGLRVGRAALR
jgi:hypothetical protein